MVRVLAPHAGDTIYDPARGTGGMLLAAGRYVEQHGGDAGALAELFHTSGGPPVGRVIATADSEVRPKSATQSAEKW